MYFIEAESSDEACVVLEKARVELHGLQAAAKDTMLSPAEQFERLKYQRSLTAVNRYRTNLQSTLVFFCALPCAGHFYTLTLMFNNLHYINLTCLYMTTIIVSNC